MMDPSALERNTTIVTCRYCDFVCLPWQIGHIYKAESFDPKTRSVIQYCTECRTTDCLEYSEDEKKAKELYQEIVDGHKFTVEVYSSEKDNCITVIEKGSKNKDLLEKDSIKLREIYGKDWNDCMTKHHKIMGWEPYKPM